MVFALVRALGWLIPGGRGEPTGQGRIEVLGRPVRRGPASGRPTVDDQGGGERDSGSDPASRDDSPAAGRVRLEPGNPDRQGDRSAQTLTHQMAIPLAYWTASQNAVVLFLRFHRHGREWDPSAVMATFTREHGQWAAAGGHWGGSGFHDAFTDPGDLRGLDAPPTLISGGRHSDPPGPGPS